MLEAVCSVKTSLQEYFWLACAKEERAHRFGDPAGLSDQKLLVLECILNSWSADAVVRIIGLENPSSPDWTREYMRASDIGKPSHLARPEVISNLLICSDLNARPLYFLIDVAASRLHIWREISRRLQKHHFSLPFYNFLAKPGKAESIGQIFLLTSKAIRGAVKSLKAETEERKFLVRNLRAPLKIELRHGSGRGIKATEDRAQEIKGDAFLWLNDFLDKLGAETRVEYFPQLPSKYFLSPLSDWRPVSNSRWDDEALGIFYRTVVNLTKACLPLLSGKIDKAPFEVLRLFDRQSRGTGSEEGGNETLEWEFPQTAENLNDAKKRMQDGPRLILQKIRSIDQKGIKPETLRRVFLLLYKGKDTEHIAAEIGLSRRRVQEYAQVLRRFYKPSA